ncbi:ABC transporter permease [Planctomycetes bacterium K23_9]|uniref:ABC-2 family transporter protein n=1 Tax=Stieleria marina TaxID=1930275 RepID=A0A517P164_9BACT|nr:ABC-2 family transporter protein [Planctomycetes bacterium K23_9]
MRPYLAVILDSFHAALSSRVLWIAFIAIWILLGALAPIGYREDLTTEFRRWDFDNGTQLKAMLAQGLADPQQESTALGRVSAALPEDLQRQLKRVAKGEEVRIRTNALADGLNEVMDRQDWHDDDAWKATARLRELRDLDAKSDDELSEVMKKRRSRLRIEAALPGVFQARASRSILLTYAGFDFPAPLPFGKEQFDMVTNQFVLPLLMNWLLGFALIFLGILVTASIVPDMLQPGSLHLLLSKPVSRSLLLLSKFLGGCAFVFLCVCQLVVGLWLIAGLRLDIWNVRLLWCIPVAVFLFSVFYSVSFFAGLRWRTPILAIGITCMFGAFVLVVGAIGGYFDAFVSQPAAIRSMVLAGDEVLSTTRGGVVQRFDKTENVWSPLSEPDQRQGDLVLPLTKLSDDTVATARIKGGRFNPYGSGSLDLQLLERGTDWEPEPAMRLPIATRRIFAVPGESLIAMNTGGLMAADWDSVLAWSSDETKSTSGTKAKAKNDSESAAPGNWLTELIRKRGGATSDFQSILPAGVTIVQPVRVAVSDDAQWMILYSLGRITRLEKSRDADQPIWLATAKRELDGEASKGAVIAISGSKLLVAREEESIKILDAESLRELSGIELSSDGSVHSAIGLADGERFMIVYSSGSSCLVSTAAGTAALDYSLQYDDVESVSLDRETDELMIAHDTDRIDFVDSQSFQVQRKIRPSLSGWRFVDRWVITPLRTLTPQTGELGQTVAALVGGKSSVTIGQNSADDGDRIRFKILRPVLSCAGFVIVMLSISCLYFARRDF